MYFTVGLLLLSTVSTDSCTNTPQSTWLCLQRRWDLRSQSHMKGNRSRVPRRIKETVSITHSKLLGIASKSHLCLPPFRRLPWRWMNRRINPICCCPGDRELNWECISVFSLHSSLLAPPADYNRKLGAVHSKRCDCWIVEFFCWKDSGTRMHNFDHISKSPRDTGKRASTNTAANSISECLNAQTG